MKYASHFTGQGKVKVEKPIKSFCRVQIHEHLRYSFLKLREMKMQRIPQNFISQIFIGMADDIPHPGNLSPWHLRIPGTQFVRQAFG